MFMRVYLREVSKSDSKNIAVWRNDSAISNHLLDNGEISEESSAIFYERNVITGKYIQYIVEKVEGEYGVFSYPVGTIYLKNFNTLEKTCEIGLFPSNDNEWNDQAKEMAIKALIEKVFREMDYDKIYTQVFGDCQDEWQLLKNVGFTIDAISKKIHEKRERKLYRLVLTR